MSASYDFLEKVRAFDDLVVGRFTQLVWDSDGDATYRRYHHLEEADALIPDKYYEARCNTTGTMLKFRLRSLASAVEVGEAGGKWKLTLRASGIQDPPYAYLEFDILPDASDETHLHHYANLLKLALPVDRHGNYAQPTFTVINDDPPLEFKVDDPNLFGP